MRPPQTARSPRPQSTDRILIDRLSQSGGGGVEIADKTLMRNKRPNATTGGGVLNNGNNNLRKMRSKSSCSASSMRAVTPLMIDNLEKPPPPSRTSASSSGALIVGDKANRYFLIFFILIWTKQNSLERSSVKSSTSSNELTHKNEQKSLPSSKSQQFVNYNELEVRFKTLTELMTRTLQVSANGTVNLKY